MPTAQPRVARPSSVPPHCLPPACRIVGAALGLLLGTAWTLPAQRPVRSLTVSALYTHVVTRSLYGASVHGDIWDIGSLGSGRLSIGGRAFIAGGSADGAGSERRQWGIAPALFLSLGSSAASTRLRLLLSVGYSGYRADHVVPEAVDEPSFTSTVRYDGAATESGVLLEHDIGTRWGLVAALIGHWQPLEGHRQFSPQASVGIQVR